MKLPCVFLLLCASACGDDHVRKSDADGDTQRQDVPDSGDTTPSDTDNPSLAPVGDFGWDGVDCPAGTSLAEGPSDPRARWCEKAANIKHGPFGRWHIADGTKAEGGDYADGGATGRWRTWYPGGSVSAEGARDGSGRTGTWTFWRADRTRESVGDFSADLKTGAWTWYWPDGAMQQAGAYANGLEQGAWKTYYPDGTADEVMTYAGGQLAGAYTKAWTDGAPRESGSYSAGLRTGEWTTWHDNGEMESRGPYVKGLKDGVWHLWDASGLPSGEGPFVDGVQHGTWSLWQWQQGERVKTTGDVVQGLANGPWIAVHDPGGEPAGNLTYYYGSREGPSRTIWKSGNTLSEGSYLSNLPHGPWKFYGPDGTLLIDCSFVLGELDGAYHEYYADGTPKAEGTYKAGLKEPGWQCWNAAGEMQDCAP